MSHLDNPTMAPGISLPSLGQPLSNPTCHTFDMRNEQPISAAHAGNPPNLQPNGNNAPPLNLFLIWKEYVRLEYGMRSQRLF